MKDKFVHIYYAYDILETQYPLDIRIGSQLSYNFFSMIKESSYESQVKYMPIINYKFSQIRIFLTFDLINLILLDLFYCYFIFDHGNNTAWFIVVFLQDVLFIIKELIPYSIQSSILTAYPSSLNQIDIILMFGIIVLICVDYFSRWEYILRFHFVWVLMLSIRVLLELRLFTPFRHFSKMILRVYVDILPFMVYLISYFFIYALLKLLNQLQYEGQMNRSDYWTFFVEGVGIAFGNYEVADGMGFFQWFLLFFTLLTLTVVMLNVIIAIVNGTYTTYETNKMRLDLLEKVDYIIDFDKFVFVLKSLVMPHRKRDRIGLYYQIV